MDKDTFPKLKNLDFEASVHVAITLLLPPTRFSQLTGLCLSTRHFSEPAQLRQLLSNISAACEQLSVLCLNLFAEGDPATARIPFAVLRPLLDCKELKRFELGHDYPLPVQEKELRDMAKAWPKLKTLRLSEDARTAKSDAKGEGVSLSFLRKVAKEMPQLERLGLYLDQGSVPTVDGKVPPEEQFKGLLNLYVGSSWVPGDDIAASGFFIAGLCASCPKIESFRSSWDWKDPPSDEAERKAKWEEVNKVVEMAFKTKAESRTAIEELQKEVETMKKMLDTLRVVPASPVKEKVEVEAEVKAEG